MSKIRVLHITQSSGGVQTYLESFVSQMDRDAFHHTLFTSPDEEIYAPEKNIFDEIVPVEMTRNINFIADCNAVYLIYKLLKANNYQIVHLHSSKAGLYGRIACYLLKQNRVVYTPHMFKYLSHDGIVRSIAKFWEIASYRLFKNRLLATSKSELQRAREEIGYKVDDSDFIYNGIEQPKLVMKTDIKYNPEIISLARFNYQKNPLMGFRAAKLIVRKYPNVKFSFIGGGYQDTFKEEMKAFTENNNLTNNVAIIDWITREDAMEKLLHSDIYISTSQSESFGYSVVEAMSRGIPVIGTNIDGTKDIVVDGKTGFLVESDDHQAMAQKIDILLNNPDLRKQMGEAGRERVAELFDVKKNVRLLEQYYRTLVHKAS